MQNGKRHKNTKVEIFSEITKYGCKFANIFYNGFINVSKLLTSKDNCREEAGMIVLTLSLSIKGRRYSRGVFACRKWHDKKPDQFHSNLNDAEEVKTKPDKRRRRMSRRVSKFYRVILALAYFIFVSLYAFLPHHFTPQELQDV